MSSSSCQQGETELVEIGSSADAIAFSSWQMAGAKHSRAGTAHVNNDAGSTGSTQCQNKRGPVLRGVLTSLHHLLNCSEAAVKLWKLASSCPRAAACSMLSSAPLPTPCTNAPACVAAMLRAWSHSRPHSLRCAPRAVLRAQRLHTVHRSAAPFCALLGCAVQWWVLLCCAALHWAALFCAALKRSFTGVTRSRGMRCWPALLCVSGHTGATAGTTPQREWPHLRIRKAECRRRGRCSLGCKRYTSAAEQVLCYNVNSVRQCPSVLGMWYDILLKHCSFLVRRWCQAAAAPSWVPACANHKQRTRGRLGGSFEVALPCSSKLRRPACGCLPSACNLHPPYNRVPETSCNQPAFARSEVNHKLARGSV
jgi:hypothetical protein